MARYSHDLLEKTIQTWQSHSEVELTAQDAIEIIDNTVALIELLKELDEKYGQAQTDL
jgi:hypothetical protein